MKTKLFFYAFAILFFGTIQLKSQNTPILDFKFNKKDSHSSQNEITIEYNNIEYSKDRYGKESSAGKFNGNDSYIKINYNINPSNTPELSMVAWVKSDFSKKQMVVFSHDDGGYDRTFTIDDRDGGYKWSAFASDVFGAKPVNAKEWTFVAVVFNQNTEQVIVNINGESKKWSSTADEGNEYFYLGASTWSDGSGYFSGLIDDVRFYDVALSENEINNIYKNESKGIEINNMYLQEHYTENSLNADAEIRAGDVDNLGFQWPDNFDPFCGQNTDVHDYPWETNPNDKIGTDRIMVGSSYKNGSNTDGYCNQTNRPENAPVPITFKYPAPTFELSDVVIQMFVDDFQAPVFGSYFQVSVDGKRLTYLEEVINSLRQTGPIGKMVTMGIMQEDIHLFNDGNVELFIDDPLTGAGDGYAIDFVQILLNPKGEYLCIGNIKGIVKDENGNLLQDVILSANNVVNTTSSAGGTFELNEMPIGLIVVSAQKTGYCTQNVAIELNKDQTKEIEIILAKKDVENADYILDELKAKGSVNLYGIHFDSNKDVPNEKSESTLNELYQMLSNNPDIKIKIIGHTDSDGDLNFNKDLSVRRANSVLKWLTNKGIKASRLSAVGLGETAPIASNENTTGKALNRRVEIQLVK